MSTQRFAQVCVAASLGALTLGLAGTAAAEDPNSFSANIGVVSNYMWRGVTQTQDDPAIQGGLDYKHASGFYAGVWGSNVDFNDDGASQDVVILADPTTASGFQEDADGNLVGTTSGASDSGSASYELDAYLGFGGSVNDDLTWDLKTILYSYPDGRDSNFAELAGSMTFKWVTLGVAYTLWGENDDGLFDNGDFYYWGGLNFADLPYGLGFSLRTGYYDFTNGDVGVGSYYTDAAGTLVEMTESADYWHYGASISKSAGDFGTFSLNWDQNSGNDDAGYDNDPKVWVGWLKSF